MPDRRAGTDWAPLGRAVARVVVFAAGTYGFVIQVNSETSPERPYTLAACVWLMVLPFLRSADQALARWLGGRRDGTGREEGKP